MTLLRASWKSTSGLNEVADAVSGAAAKRADG
jgi:hypothetical protein